MRKRVLHEPEFLDIKLLFERRRGVLLPPDPGQNYKSWMGWFEHPSGDTISSVGLSSSGADSVIALRWMGG
jgi:hypothetical protein